MPYINSDGTVIDQRSKYRLSFITDIIWAVIDVFSIFFGTLFYPNQKVKSRRRETMTPFRKKGPNIHGVKPASSASCAPGGG
mmetsp:Transcript_1064/g.2226  ORF Transcript_1064/g.2226 Transcript_1064/m.2226 type:complete len:82 (+) Transcript_1064:111-356(+)